jgi:hypothetical protein
LNERRNTDTGVRKSLMVSGNNQLLFKTKDKNMLKPEVKPLKENNESHEVFSKKEEKVRRSKQERK